MTNSCNGGRETTPYSIHNEPSIGGLRILYGLGMDASAFIESVKLNYYYLLS